jgi:acylphosphatase
MVRKRVVVEGRVQGVGFRASCAAQARAFAVTGTVRNLPDGRVEAVFEGRPEAVAALVAWCERGPGYAHVTRTKVTDEDPIGETSFRIV